MNPVTSDPILKRNPSSPLEKPLIPHIRQCICTGCRSMVGTGNGRSGNQNVNPANLIDPASTKAATVVQAQGPTNDIRIDALIDGFKWGTSSISYSFYSDATVGVYSGSQTGVAELSEPIKANIRFIVENYIEPYLNVDFVEVFDTASSHGQIRYLFSDGPKYAYAATPYPQDPTAGDVHFNPASAHTGTLGDFAREPGTHGFTTLLHETLHAIGLKHPGNYDAGGALPQGPFLDPAQDNQDNTVMTYNLGGASPMGLMPYDILALQSLYGARELNADHTNYVFNTTYGFSDGERSWGSDARATKLTIWDSGGDDVLDFSQLDTDTVGYSFDLREGGMLTTKQALNGVTYNPEDDPNTLADERKLVMTVSKFGTAIAYNTVIEDAIGSSSNDDITGNPAANTIYGNSGHDLILGNGGGDYLEGNGGSDELHGGAGSDTILGGFGNDLLVGGTYQTTGSGSSRVVDTTMDILIGGDGRDSFVLSQGVRRDVISDYQIGLDQFVLTGSMSVDNIYVKQRGEHALIYYNQDMMAVVHGVQITQLGVNDFVVI